jgi:hypothetical protein
MVFLLFFSCGSAKKEKITTAEKQEKIELKKVIIDEQLDITTTGEKYNIDSVSINKTTLSVYVNYSGGCGTHTFEAYSNMRLSKSMPPKIAVCVRHTANADACKKLVMQKLMFDVSPLLVTKYKEFIITVGNNEVKYKGKE